MTQEDLDFAYLDGYLDGQKRLAVLCTTYLCSGDTPSQKVDALTRLLSEGPLDKRKNPSTIRAAYSRLVGK